MQWLRVEFWCWTEGNSDVGVAPERKCDLSQGLKENTGKGFSNLGADSGKQPSECFRAKGVMSGEEACKCLMGLIHERQRVWNCVSLCMLQ